MLSKVFPSFLSVGLPAIAIGSQARAVQRWRSQGTEVPIHTPYPFK